MRENYKTASYCSNTAFEMVTRMYRHPQHIKRFADYSNW